MDLTITFSLLFLLADGFNLSEVKTVSNQSSSSSVHHRLPAPTDPAHLQASTTVSLPSPPFLTIHWTSLCEGGVYLESLSINSSSFPVCYSNETEVGGVSPALTGVCLYKNGCEDPPTWLPGTDEGEGYLVTERGANRMPRCKALKIRCEAGVSSDVRTQLQVYKVLTALVCCVMLILLLIRFTRPTVRALQKRLSDRRQNRWIGPTQSHSVSYHRGKVGCNDREKRLSYPALERLSASNSSEPLSNRNSNNF